MEGKTGSSTITYRLKLRCKHLDWIRQTEGLYQQVVAFYTGLLLERMELLEMGNLHLLRAMEKLTVVGRDKKPVPMELPFKKLPLYFRRAAINAAIGQSRSYAGLLRDWERKKAEAEDRKFSWKKRKPTEPRQAGNSILLYKGMYKEFAQGRIMLKLWTGRSWTWVAHTYCGREMPEEGKILSPTLVLRGNSAALHVPVMVPVDDTRTVAERVKDGERYCAVSFTSSDTLATCVLFSSDGHAIDSYFVRGGKELAYRRKRLLNTIYKNRERNGHIPERGENRRYWANLKNLNTYYTHLVSRRILDYCVKNGVKLLIAPKYAEHLAGRFLGKGSEADFLGRGILQCLGYKAWRLGIVVTAVQPHHISDRCSRCGSIVKRYNYGHTAMVHYYGGRLFECQNGHGGNASLNAAHNLGKRFLKKFAFAREEKAS